MRRPRTSPAEQYRLVMDCRQSGLSDARWCEENGIQASTFYNWVTRLRKRGCEIPPPASAPSTSFSIPSSDCAPTLKLELGGAKLEVSNDVNPELLVSVLRFLRGASC